MISCRKISKKYKAQTVFEDFSYNFKDTGFYLLFGESGCGKTTLLNILAGHIGFEAGEVDLCGVNYTNQVDAKKHNNQIDYITQDANFIEYLSVYDNLSLCEENEEIINQYLEQFNLSDKKDMLPAKLSGGEKQRICIIRSLIQKKKIILLDEPTASLDKENKELVFNVLKQLKDSVLIICSSHDDVAKKYADYCIDFEKLEEYKNITIEQSDKNVQFEDSKGEKLNGRNIGGYVKKWFKSPYKERGSRIRLAIIMILALLAMCMGDTAKNKFRSSIEYVYGINQLTLWIEQDKIEYMNELYARNDIEEIVMHYDGSVPYEEIDNGVTSIVDYESAVWTLPEQKESIKSENYIEYGRYIENENEIIIRPEYAERLGGAEASLGKTINVKLYDGEYDMTIVGVFKKFDTIQKQYFFNSKMDEYAAADYAISAAVTNKYINNKDCYNGTSRCYVIYFESYSAMMDFYEEVYVEPQNADGVFFIPPEVDMSMEHVFNMMNKYMLPIAMVIMLVAVLFYFQTQKTELTYNMKMFAVYQYLGCSIKKVKGAFVIYSVWEIIKTFFTAGIIALGITVVVNVINRRMKFIPFEIFTYNKEYILTIIVAITAVAFINAMVMLRKVKPQTIGKNLIEQRDLL